MWLRGIWPPSWVWSVSLRTKIMGMVAVGILCSSLALAWYVYRDVPASLRGQLQQRGAASAASLAIQSRDLVLTHNQFALYQLVKDAQGADGDIAYIFILDAKGNVLVHTFQDGFPTGLLQLDQGPSASDLRTRVLQTENSIIQDVAAPILGGRVGVVRLGISEAGIDTAVAEYIGNMFLLIGLTLALGLSVAYGFASILSTPITQLAHAARAVARGDFSFKWNSPLWARDEVGALGAAFRDMSDEIRRKEQMQAQLLSKVISAQEEERKRIARELHDETSQALTSLIVGMRCLEDTSKDPGLGRKTAELRALAEQMLEDAHHLATELRPSLLDDMGLASAIQRYASDWSANTGVNTDVHSSGADDLRLPPEVEVAVYRIVQEALTNITKHAEASNVSVVLGRRDSSLIVVIEDDGKGFDADRVMASLDSNGLGLYGMQERAALIGGKLLIESRPSTGTSVFLQLPLRPQGDAGDEQDKTASG